MDTTAEVGLSLVDKEMVMLIDPKECKLIWNQLVHLFLKGKQSWEPFMDLDYIYASIISGNFQLWVLIRQGNYRAVLLTEIVEYPKTKILRFIHVSGEGIFQGIQKKFRVCLEWAKSNGIAAYQIYGTRAWGRALGVSNKSEYKIVFYRDIGERSWV